MVTSKNAIKKVNFKNLKEEQFNILASKGITKKQNIDQHSLILRIMDKGWKEEQKIWWFAYEFMGYWEIDGETYFMSYKASTRVSELSTNRIVESRKSHGKLHLYASKYVLDLLDTY